jgi:tripartite-type tricarboxylate transporter receptor subunit TctC
MMITTRRSVLFGVFALSNIARAQSAGPPGIVNLVVPAPPGGSLDVIARLLQPGLQKLLNTTVIVENKSGAATSVGAADVAKAPHDGSKWLINTDPQVLNPELMDNLPFDPKELEPVLMIGTSPNVIAVYPEAPYQTLSDVLTNASKPEGVDFAVIGDTLAYILMIRLGKLAGAQLRPITYRGGAPAINDVLAGRIPVIAASASVLSPFVTDRRLRAIAQTGLERHPALPEVPTVVECGFPGFSALSFWGFYAPSNTSRVIVDRFVTNVGSLLQDKAIEKRLEESLLMEIKVAGPSEFKAFFDAQRIKWGQVIRDNGLKSSI